MITNHISAFSRYRFVDVIYSGPYSFVYKAVNVHTKLFVSIKIIKNEDSANAEKEISIHRRLHHQCIPKLIEWFKKSGCYYLIMEYFPHPNLLQYVNENRGIGEETAIKIFAQILNCVYYLHKDNLVIHKDIKLENILFDPQNFTIKLLDFGLSEVGVSNSHLFSGFCGTVPYTSPEMILKKKYSFSSDVWSLGILLYTMIKGKPPFRETNELLLIDEIISFHNKYKNNDDLNIKLENSLRMRNSSEIRFDFDKINMSRSCCHIRLDEGMKLESKKRSNVQKKISQQSSVNFFIPQKIEVDDDNDNNDKCKDNITKKINQSSPIFILDSEEDGNKKNKENESSKTKEVIVSDCYDSTIFSPELNDVILQMLEINPYHRITLDKLINHKLFANDVEKTRNDFLVKNDIKVFSIYEKLMIMMFGYDKYCLKQMDE